MSGSDVVRAYRDRSAIVKLKDGRWRKPIIAVAVAASVLAFGAIIVQANDSASVYEVNKAYNPARAARAALPQIFQPSPSRPIVQTALSYAPIFGALAPTPTRSGDQKAVTGSPRSVKVSPTARSKDVVRGSIDDGTSYCVRTCDGYFFPVGNPDAGDLEAHDQACARACPAAATAVYVAPAGSRGIEDAINRKGERYEVLRTAFNHRTQMDNACSCTGPDKPRNHSVMNDFTLRNGDYVMGLDGLRLYRGGTSRSHGARDFARVDASKLPANERKAILAMEAASARGTALSPSLRARISAQVAEAKQKVGPRQQIAMRQAMVGRKTKGSNGSDLRYVGPDADFDRAR